MPGYAQVNSEMCGSLKNGFGPFDYRADHQKPSLESMGYMEKRILVEGAHFTPRVETLIGAQSGGQIGPPGADIDYTLRAFPNNHRALISVIRLGEKERTDKPVGTKWTVECYLERAIRYASDDPIVRIIYATFLAKKRREPEALGQLDFASKLADNAGFTHYNVGLVLFDMKQFDKALISAHRALANGFTRPELGDKLKAVNQWQEPVADVSIEATSAASEAEVSKR